MKKPLLIIFILIVVGAAIFFQRRNASSTPSEGIVDVTPQAQEQTPSAVSQTEFTTLLSSITGITIDTSILQNPAFRYLIDQPIRLGTDVVGRVNPFAPVGTDSPVSGETATIKTVQPGKITATTAEFGAQVVLTGSTPVSVVFEYGTSDIFGAVTAPTTVTRSGTVLSTITSLTPNTTYVVRALLVRGSETLTGDTMTFTTRQVILP